MLTGLPKFISPSLSAFTLKVPPSAFSFHPSAFNPYHSPFTSPTKLLRLLLILTSEIRRLRSASQIKQYERNSRETLQIVLQAKAAEKFGTKQRVQELLQSVGLVGISALWKLRIFRISFFKRFPKCRLHLILLGHVRKVLESLGIIYGWDWVRSKHMVGKEEDRERRVESEK